MTTVWRTGDRGTTKGHMPYRVIAHDAKGDRGPLIALVTIGEEERAFRYSADGVHGGPHVYDLQAPVKP